ncbi:MAG: flagellin, partial [Tateyamaria sp.]|nr:flagellin [Tateyamaria sp.]
MAQAAASSVNKEMEMSMERLSTGKRINSASDDAAGIAIASRLTSEIRGTNQAIRNAMDAQSLIDTAEGAHAEVENILQRMRELAVQASNDTNATADRSMLQEEFDQLHDEINRISAATTWAGQNLLDGSGGDGNGKYNFQIGSAATSGTDNIEVTFGSLATDATIMTHNAALSTHKSGQSAVTLPSLTFQFELSTAAGTAVTDELSVAYSTTTGVVAVSDITALNAGATADIDSLVIANSTTGVTKTVAIAVGDTEALVADKIATVLASDEFEPTLSVDSSAASSGHLVISDDRNPSS